MNFLSIDYFLTVEKERNFTYAAEKLNITQQTLSANISSLEKEFGCRFFIRHTPLEITDEGKKFKEYALILNQTYLSMKREFEDINNNISGVVRIGISIMRGRTLMPGIISEFNEKYPGFEVRLTEATNLNLQQYLLNGEIDLAIAAFPDKIPGIRLYPYYDEEVVMVVSKEFLKKYLGTYTANISDFSVIKDWPFVLGNSDDMAGRIGRQFLMHQNIKPKVKAQSASMETILRMCVEGIGAAFTQRNLLKDFLRWENIDNLVEIPLNEDAKYQIRFGIQDNNYNWKVLTDLMDIALEKGNLPPSP